MSRAGSGEEGLLVSLRRAPQAEQNAQFKSFGALYRQHWPLLPSSDIISLLFSIPRLLI